MQSLSKVFKSSTFPSDRAFHKNQPKITKHNQINRLRRLESELNGTIFNFEKCPNYQFFYFQLFYLITYPKPCGATFSLNNFILILIVENVIFLLFV